jgi:hypothetical protein
MAKEISLDDVMISVEAGIAWLQFAERIALAISQLAPRKVSSIPDEQARLEDDGSLTVFVDVPDLIEISMSIPSGQWWSKQ